MALAGRLRLLSSAATSVVLVAAAGCSGAETGSSGTADSAAGASSAQTVVDDAGIAHAIRPERRRVVSTIPGITDLFVQLGETDRLVARTRYDDRAEVAHLPSIGGGLDPNLESLTALEPDLVVLWTDSDARSMTTRIRGLGMDAYSARVDGMADFRRHARQIGRLAGLEREVDSLLGNVERTFDSIEARIEGADRPSVLYVIAFDPPMIAGPGTFLDSLVTVSGGVNAFADLELAWPQVSLEAIVQRDPDVVVVSVQGGSYAPLEARRDGWSQIGAVRAGRVIEVDPDLFNRPGPGVERAALALAEALHPGRFSPEEVDTSPATPPER